MLLKQMIPLGTLLNAGRNHIHCLISCYTTVLPCSFYIECSLGEGHPAQHWGARAWMVVCGCSGREFTTKTRCKPLCVIRFLWIHVEDSGTGRQWLACMEHIQKMGVRGTWTHQHLLSYRIKGCLIFVTMYLIFHLHRLFWNTAYFFFESPLIRMLVLLLEQTEAFHFCTSVGKVPWSVHRPSWMNIKTGADNIMSSPVLWNRACAHHNVECFLQYCILEGIKLPVQERGWILCENKSKIVLK